MNPAIILRLLDLAFLGLTAWERYDANRGSNTETSARIANLRQRLLTGDVSDDAAVAEIDALIESVRSRRVAAMSRLPVYGVQELDGD